MGVAWFPTHFSKLRKNFLLVSTRVDLFAKPSSSQPPAVLVIPTQHNLEYDEFGCSLN